MVSKMFLETIYKPNQVLFTLNKIECFKQVSFAVNILAWNKPFLLDSHKNYQVHLVDKVVREGFRVTSSKQSH